MTLIRFSLSVFFLCVLGGWGWGGGAMTNCLTRITATESNDHYMMPLAGMTEIKRITNYLMKFYTFTYLHQQNRFSIKDRNIQNE